MTLCLKLNAASGLSVPPAAVVQDNSALSVDISHRNHTVVQASVAPIAQNVLLVLGIGVVVAAALGELLAEAVDRLRLCNIEGRVVEGPAVGVRIVVDTVVPCA
jgi:hypothetical protein